jgi:GT2 family glycosyltransferase/peptidoglycan/xylan/chitin deacetylase (PgdA/CDA1 family)
MSEPSSAAAPRLSVVVPTYQRRDLLGRTLPTILDQDTGRDGFEVVVVVDGSTDGTVELLAERFSGRALQVLSQPNCGPARARNAGIRVARGELVLLLDDDILCPPGLLAAHLAAHGRGGRKVVFGPVLGLEGDSTAAELTRLALDDYYRRMRDEWDPNTAPTAYAAPNTSLPRQALLAAGGFDPRFACAHEDADLGLRLRAMGLPFEHLADAITYQVFTKSAQSLAIADAAVHGRGEILLCRTHPCLRSQSFLRRIGEGGLLRRAARAIACVSPLPPDWILRPAFEVAERLPVRGLARVRLAMLARRSGVQRLRAATAAAGGWRALRGQFGRRCASLLYHHVGPPPDGVPGTLTTSAEVFRRQMRWLRRRGFTGISAGRWLDWLESGRALPDKPVVLTFDDAYADLALHAFPILEECGFGATVFVVTGRVGGSNAWDATLGIPSMAVLDRETIQAWSRRGIEFGAHSRTHQALDAASDDALRNEIQGSRTDLESLIGQPVRTFAYPYGVHSPSAVAMAGREFGLSFTCSEGVNTLATDRRSQCRSMVQPTDSLLDLELRARLGCSPLSRMRTRLRMRTRIRAVLGGRARGSS